MRQLAETLSVIFKGITIDMLVGAASILVVLFNELWSDKAKTRIVYKTMPSDTVFSRIALGNVDAMGFDLEKAKELYSHLSEASANKQTAEWNLLLRKSKEEKSGNVIETQRMQLMIRDICVSAVSLTIMSIIVFLLLFFYLGNLCDAIRIIALPLVYLVIMFFVTRKSARNRAERFLMIVIKDDVQRRTCE